MVVSFRQKLFLPEAGLPRFRVSVASKGHLYRSPAAPPPPAANPTKLLSLPPLPPACMTLPMFADVGFVQPVFELALHPPCAATRALDRVVLPNHVDSPGEASPEI